LPNREKDQATEHLVIMPPVEFNQPGDTVSTLQPLNIDLSQANPDLSSSSLNGLIYRKTIPALPMQTTTDSNYTFYGLNPDFNKLVEPNLEPLTSGISDAEEMFGFEKGEAVTKVNIVSAAAPNATFNLANPDAIHIREPVFEIGQNTDPATQLALVTRHETFHAIDGKTRFQLSDNAFNPLIPGIKESNPEFFTQLDETNFLDATADQDTISFGGHSAENSGELFASLANSLSHPNWEQRISEHDSSFRDTYKSLLSALSESLSQQPAIPGDAPIHQLLKDRIEFLEKN
jgi:hypothetical protein